jgi:hypothetical protein
MQLTYRFLSGNWAEFRCEGDNDLKRRDAFRMPGKMNRFHQHAAARSNCRRESE